MAIAKEEQARGTFRKPVVLLAERDRADMDAALDALRVDGRLDIVTRSGCPHCIDDLEKVAAGAHHHLPLNALIATP